MDKLRKVGVTGPVSEINFGDYAMFINNMKDIDCEEIHVFTYNKVFSKKIINAYLSDKHVYFHEISLKIQEANVALVNVGKVGFLPFNEPTATPIDLFNRVNNYDEIYNIVHELNLLIVSGGGFLNHLWNNSLWRSDMLKKIFIPILIANQQRKDIYFTGNGIGPFDQSEEFFNYFFNYLRNTTIAVRDRMYSQKYLARIGVSDDIVHFVPDDLYYLSEKIDRITTSEVNRLKQSGRYLLLELYYPLDEIIANTEEIKDFCETIYIKYGLSTIFVPFDFERGGEWQGKYLAEQINHFYIYDLSVLGYLPIQDIRELIGNAELVVCNRYHAFVLAISAGVPVINILKKVCGDHRYYFNKVFGVLEYSFESIKYNENDYMAIDFVDALACIKSSLPNIIEKQKEVYNNEQHKLNKKMLLKLRHDYISKINEKLSDYYD